jgi:D-aminopeptidase
MRVALVFDMEGTSHITDIREPFPMYLEYWRSGREKLTADIVAATKGLLKGGATEVWVLNHHGAGEEEWPNVIVERLPERTRIAEEWGKQAMRENVDAMFQVGVHARGGSPTFQSHTLTPGLRFRHQGELLSESHWWAWTGNVPVLGMVGSEQLGRELGSRANVPFLAVQRSDHRAHAEPVFRSPHETAAAIESFAEAAARDAADRRPLTPTGPIRLEASMQIGNDGAGAMTEAGWTRTSRTEFAIEAEAWRGEGERVDNAIHAAAETAWAPYAFWFDGLDPSSEETALAYGGDAWARSDAMLRSWSTDRTSSWFEPSATDGHWEGFQAGAETAAG